MRLPESSIFIWAWLAATAAAVQLGQDDVPFQCVNMCGPMVELTGVCNIGNPDLRRLKRRKTERRGVLDALGLNIFGGRRTTTVTTVKTVRPPPETRTVSAAPLPPLPPPSPVIITLSNTGAVAAPFVTPSLGPPPAVVPTSTLNLRPPPPPTRITPIIVPASSRPALGVIVQPDDDDAASSASAAQAAQSTGGMQYMDQKQTQESQEEAVEETCMCVNNSFDIRAVAPLCAACILQAGDQNSPMNIVMSECNFTSTTYVPEKTSLVKNVVVVATRPAFSAAGASAGIASAAQSCHHAGLALGAAVLSALCGAMLLL